MTDNAYNPRLHVKALHVSEACLRLLLSEKRPDQHGRIVIEEIRGLPDGFEIQAIYQAADWYGIIVIVSHPSFPQIDPNQKIEPCMAEFWRVEVQRLPIQPVQPRERTGAP